MTEAPDGSPPPPPDPTPLDTEIRRVADRLRRRKRALQRRNPLNDLDEYRRRFREVVALEAQLRDLKQDRSGGSDGERARHTTER